MASTDPIKILEVSQVTPPSSDSEGTELSLPLTFLDMFWLKFQPVQRIYFYELNELTPAMFNLEILPKLKHTLALALLHFLPLAGNLTWPLHEPKPIILYTPKDGVSVTVAESYGSEFHRLSVNEMHDALDSHLYLPQLSISDNQVSVFAIQITLFPDKGFCIGYSINHAVLDGVSITMFMKAWSRICKHNSVILPTELIPFYDRTVIQDPHGIDMVYLNHWMSINSPAGNSDSNARSLKPVPATQVPASSVRAKFRFSLEDIRTLRKRVLCQLEEIYDNKDTKSIHLSSFVVTFAYAVFCIVKARGLKYDEKILVGFPADCRARLNPPIPKNYFGNSICSYDEVLEVGALMKDNGIAFLAQKLSEMVKGLEKGIDHEEEKKKVAKYFTTKPSHSLAIWVAGSTKFEVYGIDFGWGQPKCVEITSIDKSGAISMAESKDGGGGVEIGLVLKKHEMEMFKTLFVDGL